MPLFASFAGHQFLLTSKMKNNIQTVRNQLLFINGGGGGGGGGGGESHMNTTEPKGGSGQFLVTRATYSPTPPV